MEIKKINEMGWVKNGDPCTGIFSISDLVGTDYDETEYEYGINEPYYNLAKNDKVLVDRLENVVSSFDPSEAAKRVIPNRVFVFQYVPDLSVQPTNSTYKLYDWKLSRGIAQRGISAADFNDSNLRKENYDAVAPGLDSRSESINLINYGIKIGDKISITTTLVMRPFSCALDMSANGRLTVSSSYTKNLVSMPIHFNAKSTGSSNGVKVWRPVRNGCTYQRQSTVIHTVSSTKEAMLTFRFETMGGTANRYLAPAMIDVEIRQLNPLF